eukprot:XP_015575946.1 dual specificity protein kinase splB [Ricinus communis]
MQINMSKKLSDLTTGEAPSPSPSSQWIQQQQELASFVPKTGKNVRNLSMQTGEEFSMEFLQDRVATGGVSPLIGTVQTFENGIGRNHDDRNHQRGYEDLANILGLRRMDSECTDDFSDFVSAKGSLKETESGFYVDKLNKLKMEDNDTVHRSGKGFGNLDSDRRAGLGTSASAVNVLESPCSAKSDATNVSDRSQPGKMKFLCSSGGKILPRPSDGKLRYVGGETRIISISKNVTWEELVKKTKGICTQPHSIKYQLPGEDLDSLISVSSDEDLQNMIEEYYGLERLDGSQRLRIFLIPLSESDTSSSFDGTTIQQDSPNYQYVVAVNGILDPSPRKSSGGQCSAPTWENKSGFNAFHFNKFSNESLNMHQSPPISPLTLQHRDSKNAHVKFHADSSSTESSSSFSTALLPPENCDKTAFYKQPCQGLMALMNHHHPCNNDEIVQPDQPQMQSHNHNLGTELVATASVFHQSEVSFNSSFCEKPMIRGRMFHSEKPLGPEDPMGLSSGSVDTIYSHHGMPHAFSDSKLQEHGGLSAYCSQEGMSPSSPLNFSKTQLCSLVSNSSQEKSVQLQENINFVNPTLQGKLVDIEATDSQRRLDLLDFSSSPKSARRNDPTEKVTTNAGDQSQISNKCKENVLGLDTMNTIDKSNFLLNQGEKPCEEKSLAGVEYMNILPYVNCNTRSSAVDTLGQSMNISEDKLSASSAFDFRPSVNILINHPQNYHAKDQRTANDQYGSLSGKVNREQESNIPRASIPEVVELFQNTKLRSRGEDSSVDLISGSSSNPFFPEPTQVQPLENQNDISNKESTLISSSKSYPSAVLDDSGPNKSLPLSDLDASANNAANDASYEGKVYPLDDHGSYPHLRVEKCGFRGSSCENTNVLDIMLAQTNAPSKNNIQNQLEPLVIVEAVTSDVPHIGQSSHAVFPRVASPHSCDFISPTALDAGSVMPHVAMHGTDPTINDMSPSATELECIVPHVCPHIANLTSSDFIFPTASISESLMPETDFDDINDENGDKDNSISDAVIAEMEASIYGLQIIKNADLEELKELGSGTYGTVYHGKWRGTDVAIKRIKKSCFSGRSSEQERLTKDFWREAQILSNLHHPNVVAFYGVVPDGAGGTLATVTEYMVNGSLRHVLLKKDRSLDRRKKLIIAMDAAFGMEYLHSKNIVHFDLKCDNLLVNLRDPQRPICKVGDFGLSRIKRNTLVSGGVRGTLPWMAPELLNGSSNRVSEKVDVFSFGISLWEILTGEEPYADMHCGAIIGGIVKNTLRPPIPDSCDPEWRKLMEQCWSPDPDSRPSFTEVTNRLRTMSLQAKGHNIQPRQMKAKQLS